MSAVSRRSDAVGADRPGGCALCRLGVLRWLTLVSFNAAYVVVPLLLFERTRSLTVVGLAMFGEGLLRSGLALGVGVWARRLGARRGTLVAAVLRLVALAMLAVAVVEFSVVLVALASTVFYIGHFFATLEQELRAATFGARAVAAQTVHRVAEVLAPPAAFAIALAAQALQQDYALLLGAAALGVVAQAAGFLAWFRHEPPRAGVTPGLAASWRHLRASPALSRGLLASIVGFTFYGWAVLATPFALTGRTLAGLALDSAAGIALFKTVAALVGVGGALLFARLLGRPGGERGVIAAAAAAPLAFALGLNMASDLLAVALLALVCAMVLGLFTWQRRLRQVVAAPEQFHGVTTWCMAFECLHVSMIGLALIADRPWTLGLLATAAMLLLLLPRSART